MDSVEASTTAIEQTTNVINEAPVATPEDEMGAIWDRIERDNNAARDASGRFASTKEETAAVEATPDADAPLEGGEAGEAETVAESSTPAAVEVPLPSNWRGLEETWAKIPAEARPAVKAHMEKLQQQASDLGREVATYKPVNDVVNNYKEYFDGTAGSYKREDAVNFLFNLQRQMDQKPVETLLEIADRYQLRPHLAEMFGAGSTSINPDTQALLSEISQLKTYLGRVNDPNVIDERITKKLNEDRVANQVNEVISRTATKEAMPLYSDVEAELPFYINKAWAKLGETASQDAVLKLGYDMAINADPDLRSKVAAPKVAATNTDPARLAAAKNANQSNLRSTSTGKTRELSDEEALGAAWDKATKG